MAKTKKETVDLAKPEKVSDVQLKKIQSVVDRINRTQMNIGTLETRKHQALHYLAGVNDELKLVQDELQEEYGTFDVDIETGTINYPQEGAAQPNPNTQGNVEADKKD